MPSTQTWELSTGTARAIPSSDKGIVKPLVLAAESGTGATDLDAFQARLFPRSYSFGDAVRARDYDLILVGYTDGNAALADQTKAVKEAILHAMSKRSGDAPLTVGGVGRGALAARYALARMETEQMEHQTKHYFSYNGTAPTTEESIELKRWQDGWPPRPIKLKLVTNDVADELSDDDFDYTTTGAADPGGRLITSVHGSWLLDHLDR